MIGYKVNIMIVARYLYCKHHQLPIILFVSNFVDG